MTTLVLAIGRPAFPLIYAPYKCAAVPYDGLGFSGFPERSRWEIDDRPRGDGDHPMREAFILRRLVETNSGMSRSDEEGLAVDQSVDEKAAFVQAWLFFGA
jgi:hypothetical protein